MGTFEEAGADIWLYFFGSQGAARTQPTGVTMQLLGRITLATLGVSSVLLVSVPRAGAADVTIAPNRDNSIFEDGPERSCAIGSLYCGQTGAFGVRRALIRFDVAGSIPPGSTITSVQVDISIEAAGPLAQATDVHTLHRLPSDWGETTSECFSGVGALAEAGDATWTHKRYDTDLWSQAGGDFAPTPSGSVGLPTSGVGTWISEPGLVADVQSWLDLPSGNFGWILIGNEAVARNARKFFSRDSAAPPSLRVEFTSPPVPPPAVPDGATGTPFVLSKLSPDGADLGVFWDGALCSGDLGHNLVYGTRAGFPAAPLGLYALGGSVCSLGASSPYVWSGSPDPAVLDPSTKLIWMLVLANDATTTEGSWGRNSLSQERNGPGLDGCSNQCGILDKSLANTCGNGF